ncbi:MAG: trypsin-like serine protease [Bacteroidota bacterium]
MKYLSYLLAIGLTSVELCAQDFQLETQVQAIKEFIPGQVDPITVKYNAIEAEIVRNSFAVGNFNGCTGTWIGPNTVITAAHCGDIRNGRSYEFALEGFPNKSLKNNRFSTRSYSCLRQLSTGYFASNYDFALWECLPKNNSDLPGGIRYGFANYYPRQLNNGDRVYSIWRNQVSSAPSGAARVTLYSEGSVTHEGLSSNWSGPDFLSCRYETSDGKSISPRAISVSVNTHANPGASGSTHFDFEKHAIVIGPTATGQTDSRGRNATSIATNLGRNLPDGERGLVETNLDASMVEPTAQNGGLIPTRLTARIAGQEVTIVANCRDILALKNLAENDANRDGLFDVQGIFDIDTFSRRFRHWSFNHPLERFVWKGVLVGGIARAVDFSGLGSFQFTHGRDSAFQISSGQSAKLSGIQVSPGDLEVSISVNRARALSSDSPIGTIRVIFRCVTGGFQTTSTQIKKLDLRISQLISMPINLRCNANEIEVVSDNTRPGTGVDFLNSLSISPRNSVMRFETIDERDMWRGSQSKRALFTADGRNMERSGLPISQVGFFGLQIQPGHSSILTGRPLISGERYKLTLDAKTINGTGNSSMIIHGGGSAKRDASVSPDWQSFSWEFSAPDSQAALALRVPSGSGFAIVVDNLLLERL